MSSVRSTAASGSQVYESKRAVNEYILMHFGLLTDYLPIKTHPALAECANFVQRCAKLCNVINSTKASDGERRALDIGCAVGGSSFELTKDFDEVIGVDFSQHFIDAANDIKENGKRQYDILSHGKVFQSRICEVDPSINRNRVKFFQGDACNLSPELGKFDAILASNLLCRLPSPRKFLSDVPKFLKPGGQLILISPYSWLEEYTIEEEWLGGKKSENGQDSASVIIDLIQGGETKLTLVHREDIPFLIREHERKYQLGLSDCMIWQNK